MMLKRMNPWSWFIFCVALLFGVGYFAQTFNWTFKKGPPKYELKFLPKTPPYCEAIPLNVTMSPSYALLLKQFDEAVANARIGEQIEGFSAQTTAQYDIIHYLVQQEATKVVCETGFNLGHSSFNYLTASDRVIVHSFDLGNHQYAHKMSKYLAEKFPNRFFVHFGDSTKTIPEFISSHPGFQCDVIFVDGGHVYHVALADLRNFAKIANLEENVVLFDDYPTNWGAGFGQAWEVVVKEGIIEELTRCTFKQLYGLQRGFTMGRVVKTSVNQTTTAKPSR